MKQHFSSTVFSLITSGLLFTSLNAYADDATSKPVTQADVEAIVKKTIHDNPDLIIGAVEEYQIKKRQEEMAAASANIGKMQGDLKNSKVSPSAGNPNADVTIVEFFDYHCGYCKQFVPTISKLVDSDGNLRVVFKEFPILAEDSSLAAKAALAVNSIDKDKYFKFHASLMQMSGKFTIDNLTKKAEEAGISSDDFKKAMANPDIDKELQKNKELAVSLNIHGTPALIIGTEVVPGVIPFDALKEKVTAARKKS